MRSLICLLLLTSTLFSQNQFGEFATAVFLKVNQGDPTYYSCNGEGADKINYNVDFKGYLGAFKRNSNDLLLKGAEIKSWNNDQANVCGGTMHYILYKVGNRPKNPVYSTMDLPWESSCGWFFSFENSPGGCQGNDKKWQTEVRSIGLTKLCPATYRLEVFFSLRGSNKDPKGCNETLLFDKPSQTYMMDFDIIEESQPELTTSASKKIAEEGERVQLFADISNTDNEYSYKWKGNHFESTDVNPLIASISNKQFGMFVLEAMDQCGNILVSTIEIEKKPKKKEIETPIVKSAPPKPEPREKIKTIVPVTAQSITKTEVKKVQTKVKTTAEFSAKDKVIAAKKESRANEVVATIQFTDPNIRLFINDFGKEDGDRVTIFYNNKIVMSDVKITKSVETIELRLEDDAYRHELFFVAENMGKIPPNTGKVAVRVDNKVYKHHISSSETSNAKFIFEKK